jgi:hypothetical protein
VAGAFTLLQFILKHNKRATQAKLTARPWQEPTHFHGWLML